ncbi:MAG: hypothetical protein JWO05_1053 [Gemmatimonadetes bacterium]|nr:hypothetical protein [Gemmatimonadota bacterium]
MRTVPVSRVGSVPESTVDRAQAGLGERRTLADVLQWGREQSPTRDVVEIVTQDEYTHDVVIPFEAGHFLVFDAT